jgi:uncharacterized OB-fold protein
MSNAKEGSTEMITDIATPVYLKYQFIAGKSPAKFLTQLKNGVLTGQSCPICSKVYCPPRGSCPACGVATRDEVVFSGKATVDFFTIVAIPIPGNTIKPPYVVANLVADGAHISFIHLMSECNNDEVHKGQRVEAVWLPEVEWDYAMSNISYFKPLDEPDISPEKIGKLTLTGEEE